MPTPEGQRFSLAYLERGAVEMDSVRLRRRLAKKFSELASNWMVESEFGKLLVAQTGADVKRVGDTHLPVAVFESGDLRDLLDAITLFYRFLGDRFAADARATRGYPTLPDPREWSTFVARAFSEENVGYRLDAKGGVHFFVDQEFEHNRFATVAVLEHPSLANARSVAYTPK